MDLGIRGKRALVLGANGGLGSAVATALAGTPVQIAPQHTRCASTNGTGPG